MTFYHDPVLIHTPCFLFSLIPAGIFYLFFYCFPFILLYFFCFHLAVEIIVVIGEQNIFSQGDQPLAVCVKAVLTCDGNSNTQYNVALEETCGFSFVLDKLHKWNGLLSGEYTGGWDNCQKK